MIGRILQLLCSPIGKWNFQKRRKPNITTEWTPQSVFGDLLGFPKDQIPAQLTGMTSGMVMVRRRRTKSSSSGSGRGRQLRLHGRTVAATAAAAALVESGRSLKCGCLMVGGSHGRGRVHVSHVVQMVRLWGVRRL